MDKAEELAHAERLHDRQFGIETPRIERPGLLDRAIGDHPFEARVGGRVKRLPGGGEHHGLERQARRRAGAIGAMPRRERAARRPQHLPGADQALGIAGLEAGRRFRVEAAKLPMECLAAKPGMKIPRRGPHLAGNLRYRRKPLHQGLEVEPGAADDDRQFSTRKGGADLIQRHLAPAPGRTRLIGGDDAVKPMRDAGAGGGGGLGGEDFHIPVDLHGVGVDDDAAEPFRHRQGEGRLAARGRSGDDEDAGRLLPRPRASPSSLASVGHGIIPNEFRRCSVTPNAPVPRHGWRLPIPPEAPNMPPCRTSSP